MLIRLAIGRISEVTGGIDSRLQIGFKVEIWV
jgi:hypothetical protein